MIASWLRINPTGADLHDLAVAVGNVINGDERTTEREREVARIALAEIVRRAEAAAAKEPTP